MRAFVYLTLVMLSSLGSFEAFSSRALAETGVRADNSVIVAVVADGNTKTTDATVKGIAGVSVGQEFSINQIDDVTKRLVESGLFKSVNVYTQNVVGGVRVVLSVQDKHSWVVAPTAYLQPTNKGAGGGFGENNLFGNNKKMLLYGQLATGDSFFFGAYVDPSIGGSRFRWQFDTYLSNVRTIEYASAKKFIDDPKPIRQSRLVYLNAGLKIGAQFGAVGLDARLRGAKVSMYQTKLIGGASLADVSTNSNATAGDSPGADGWDVSAEGMLTIDKLSNWYGIRDGALLRIGYEQGLKGLGSDFYYWITTFKYVRAVPFFRYHNLLLKVRGGYGHKLPYQHEFTAGGTQQRGYLNEQFRGNFSASASLEYSFRLFEIKGVSLYGLGFVDSSYVGFISGSKSNLRNYLPDYDRLGLAPFKNSIGVGTRMYMKQIVLPLLGVDVGYSLERQAYEVYLAIGLTDV